MVKKIIIDVAKHLHLRRIVRKTSAPITNNYLRYIETTFNTSRGRLARKDFFGKLRKTVGVDPPTFQSISLLIGNRVVQTTKLKFSVDGSFTANNNITYISAIQ